MHRNIKLTIAFMASICLSLSSCKKDFLEIVPKGYLVATTYEDYRLLMNSSTFYQYSLGGGWQAAALMGDEVAAEEAIFNTSFGTPAHMSQARNMFRWDDVVFLSTDQESTSNFTGYFLRNIYTLNKIIGDISSASGGTDQQKAQLVAEARAMRAFIYFQLINYYAKPYNPATAATDPGFPIMTDADITMSNLQRSSVQGMYDFIIADMTASLTDIAINPEGRTHMSRAGVQGLLGKVYLSMNRYAAALEQFNACRATITTMQLAPRFYNYNVTLATGGSFLPIDVTTGPNSPFNNATDLTESVVATMFTAGTSFNGYGTNFLVMHPSTMALFDPSDWRLKFYSSTSPQFYTYTNGKVRKNGMNVVRFGLELPDLYLLSAECKARTGDLSGAVTDLQTLRSNRLPAAQSAVPATIAADQNALIRFTLQERIREFAGTGYRWFDMRRLSVDPLFASQPAATHTLFLINGGTNTYTLRPERLTLRIPPNYISENPGMINNP